MNIPDHIIEESLTHEREENKLTQKQEDVMFSVMMLIVSFLLIGLLFK